MGGAKNRKNIWLLAIVTFLLIALAITDTLLVFQMTSGQTRQSGIYRLESISGELEGTINEARILTAQMGIKAQALVGDQEALADFIYRSREELSAMGNGAFNIYIAGSGWDILPGLTNRDGFVAVERNWYVGAKRAGGNSFVTPPYIDAVTGNICYTISILLGDGDTVLGIDYTMENIQAHILQMYETGSREAVIVMEDGIIAGCSDESLLGKQLNTVLPDYAAIFSLAKTGTGVATTRIKADYLYENLFAAQSGNGWYLIVGVSDWDLYRYSYIALGITLLITIALLAIIIILYVFAIRSSQNTQKSLWERDEFLRKISGELYEPARRIRTLSDPELMETPDRATFAQIHAAGEQLSEMIGRIELFSRSAQPDRAEIRAAKKARRAANSDRNTRFLRWILTLLILVSVISLYTNLTTTLRWGTLLMENQVNQYEYQLSEWIDTQKSILDMFCSIIAANPGMLEDYDGTIEYLNEITTQYPQISVSYMTNPNLNPTVFMNNGWLPEEDWHVEERQWYIDTMASESGFSISAPYFDEQTGLYCVTFSERVYSRETGQFLGNFGIDFYMDKLVEILGSSYSENSYAFLVDAGGYIINHPYGSYQMSTEKSTNVSSLPYGALKPNGENTLMFRDYNGTRKILIASRNEASNFTVYVAAGVWMIYGRMIASVTICFIAFVLSIILVYRLLRNMISWQEDTNRQMRDAAETAIAAEKAKSQFLAQMSHEIRTPINAVLGMNEMILRESGEPGIREYASDIQTAGKSLLSLVNGILDFSKIEDGKLELMPVRYELVRLLDRLVFSIAHRAEARHLDFRVDVDPQIPRALFGDDVRIEQIILNLLTNAVKYTEKGSVTLRMSLEEHAEGQAVLFVQVKDTGIGIRQEDMSRLTESFSRLDERRNRRVEGTGLGMTIVTRLLEMMGSELEIESVYGAGSVFSFRLRQPIVDETPMGPYDKNAAHTPGPERESISLHAPGARVLVVDDNSINLKVARNLLGLFGIKAELAHSGEKALELVKESRYDVILLDHMMPEMDGIETLERMRAEKCLPRETTVIALTANAIVGARETYLAAGFDDYLSKPLDLSLLEKKLQAHLPESAFAEPGKGAGGVSDEDFVMEFAPETESEEADAEGVSLTEALRVTPLNISEGMHYCGDSEALYLEILTDYVKAYEERASELEEALRRETLDRYQIYAHSLKSTSLTIGAIPLSSLARSMESAAKQLDLDTIRLQHDDMMKQYRELVDLIKQALQIYEDSRR
ncbi:MAG: response regulator [Lachnospiraceae bacterium]|nr:response regulator [Lachnospiraceae bacterium]